MRSLSLFIIGASLAAIIVYVVMRPGTASADPLNLFVNRALNPHLLQGGQQPDPEIGKQLDNSAVGQIYCTAKPERSVLIYDCGQDSSWCNQNALSFPAMFEASAKIAGTDPKSLASDWYVKASDDDAVLSIDLNSDLSQDHVQLLAITNRMDMASWDGSNWKDAEIHLAYGPVPSDKKDPAKLTMIFEFKLKPIGRNEFQQLAILWLKLPTAGDYAAALQTALVTSGIPIAGGQPGKIKDVRLRLNHQAQADSWQLSQFRLDLGTRKFVPQLLDDQIKVPANSSDFKTIWLNADYAIQRHLPYAVPTDPNLLASSPVKFNSYETGLGTPLGVCDFNIETRNALGLQVCTRCHTVESNLTSNSTLQFQHIPNRSKGQSTVPSGFLVGGKGQLHPKLSDLYYGATGVVWPATIQYTRYKRDEAGSCTTPDLASVTRYFHDVARRTLFLAAVAQGLTDARQMPMAVALSTGGAE